jgi:hypothetical protein
MNKGELEDFKIGKLSILVGLVGLNIRILIGWQDNFEG